MINARIAAFAMKAVKHFYCTADSSVTNAVRSVRYITVVCANQSNRIDFIKKPVFHGTALYDLLKTVFSAAAKDRC